ncbi:hypothetical protein ACWDHW_08720 [Streptomyces melanosporofaciens]
MATTTPRPAALDVPAEQVAAEVPLHAALLLDSLQQAMPLSDPDLCEQRHFLDADADTCVPLPGVAHPKTAGGAA